MADLTTTVARWKSSASTAQTRYTEGIQSTTKDVAGLAVASEAKLLQGFNESVQSGRWRNGVMRGGTAYWKQQAVAKANNFSTGIAAGEQKFAAAMQTWLPIINSASQQVQAMPNNSFADSLARMNAFATALHNAKLQGA